MLVNLLSLSNIIIVFVLDVCFIGFVFITVIPDVLWIRWALAGHGMKSEGEWRVWGWHWRIFMCCSTLCLALG
jgi:hypothetical protein